MSSEKENIQGKREENSEEKLQNKPNEMPEKTTPEKPQTHIESEIDIYSEHKKWYTTVISFFKDWTPFIMAIATIVIAKANFDNVRISKEISAASNRSVNIYNKLAEISQSSLNVEEQIAQKNTAALQAEFRPYLVVEPLITIKPNIPEAHIDLTFCFKNIGKIPALNIAPEYSSHWIDSQGDITEIQTEVPIESPEKSDHLMPGKLSICHEPRINISGIDNRHIIDKLKLKLNILYEGNPEIDSRTYCSEMILFFGQVKNNDILGFVFKEDRLTFGFEKNGECISKSEKNINFQN